ncbi:MAG: universal stress protein [Pseudomonadota bacterium]
MTPKSILVHVAITDANSQHHAPAIALAAEHGAHITGAMFNPAATLPPMVMADVPAEWLQEREKQAHARNAKTANAFREQAAAAGVTCDILEAHGAAEDLGDQFAALARQHDLTIVGQTNADHADGISGTLLQSALFGSGRPILIVPYAGAPGAFDFSRILVAWDGGAAASRAAHDAIMLMSDAKDVDVVSVDMGKGDTDKTGPALATHLARHGVTAKFHQIPSGGIDAANAILSHASDMGANLIVMGGYGHSRLREFLLGGATRTILSSMTAPVLMAH